MGKVLVFLAGLVAGAGTAHVVSRTPAGARAFAVVNAATDRCLAVVDGFLAVVSDSFRARMAEAL